MLRKVIKKISVTTIPLIGCITLFCVLVFLIDYRLNAASAGAIIGEKTGICVGRAIGSIEGLTKGQKDGTEAGKDKGLSGEDTIVEISGKIKEVARLQVLVASGTYADMVIIGEEKDYAAIISQDYNAVFTVDLANADIYLEDSVLYITLDQPVAQFNTVGDMSIDNEYQKHGFKGYADDGNIAAINVINKLKEEGMKALKGYEAMMTSARASAEAQLKGLVKAVSISSHSVHIEWRET